MNKDKADRIMRGEGDILVKAAWWDENDYLSQLGEYNDREASYRYNTNKYNAGLEAVRKGFDNLPVVSFFGDVAYLLPLAMGSEMVFQNQIIAAHRLFANENDFDSYDYGTDLLNSGLYKEIFRRIDEFQSRYPQIPISVPDTQSPIDVLNILLGVENTIYMLNDEPEKCLKMLDYITKSIIRVNRAFEKAIVNFAGFSAMEYLPDCIHVSDDDAAYLSPEIYRDFAQPFNNELSAEFGGISFHCCMGYAQNIRNHGTTKGLKRFDCMPYYNPVKNILDNIDGKVWKVVNMSYAVPPDNQESGLDFFKRIIDINEKRARLWLKIYSWEKDDAFILAEKVKEYCLFKGYRE